MTLAIASAASTGLFLGENLSYFSFADLMCRAALRTAPLGSEVAPARKSLPSITDTSVRKPDIISLLSACSFSRRLSRSAWPPILACSLEISLYAFVAAATVSYPTCFAALLTPSFDGKRSQDSPDAAEPNTSATPPNACMSAAMGPSISLSPNSSLGAVLMPPTAATLRIRSWHRLTSFRLDLYSLCMCDGSSCGITNAVRNEAAISWGSMSYLKYENRSASQTKSSSLPKLLVSGAHATC